MIPHAGRQEFTDQLCNHIAMLFQGEVPRIEQMKLQLLQVSFVRMCAVRRKDLVILTPNNQCRWLVITEVLLPLRVTWRVTAVVKEQRQLDFLIARSIA